MCGIVCYTGEKNASKVIKKGLEKLEYRGYDSAGIATVGNPSLKVSKGEGTINQVLNKELDGNTGIGHTRWATHGKVNKTNAHPHTCSKEKIAVVHNGIIDNHEELRKELGEERFKSETDTEVIPHLIEEQLKKTDDLEKLCRNVINKLEGSYAAVAVLDTGEKIAFRKGSPLVLGVGEDEYFLTSDVTPFLEHTRKAVFLEEEDYVIIKDDYQIYNSGEKIDREVKQVDWNAEQASKKGYDHYMHKEIEEQTETVKRAAFQDRKDLQKAVKLIEEAEKVYITGCGTSSFAAELGASYLRETGTDVEVEQAHELEYRKDEISEDDLVISMSQSGETADLLSLLNKVDAETLAIVNVVGSTLDRNSRQSLYINAGPEIGVASTKAFTGQLTVLKLLQYALEDKTEEGRKELVQTSEKISETLENSRETVREASKYLSDKEDVYFIGRHRSRFVSKEASLKLKEISYIHSEAFPGGEFKHGTLALVEQGTPVIGILTGKGENDTLSNLVEAKSRGADIIGIGTEEKTGFKHFIEIPEDSNTEILETVVFQLLAYRTALNRDKDINPDRPRNLAKSVTVK